MKHEKRITETRMILKLKSSLFARQSEDIPNDITPATRIYPSILICFSFGINFLRSETPIKINPINRNIFAKLTVPL